MSAAIFPTPLTPATCDLRDFPRMMVDIPRLFASGFNAAASRNPIAWMIGHKLWYRSWHQTPAASLPDDDEELCHLVELGFDVKTFRKAKDAAMRGWLKCADGRLYHPVVAEAALESWIEKLNQRLSSGAGNAKRWKSTFDPKPIEDEIAEALTRLRMLNPQSKSIAKLSRRLSGRAPDGVPPGQDNDPGGIADGNADVIPVQSQETGTGTGTERKIIDEEGAGELDWSKIKGLGEQLRVIADAAGMPLDPSKRRWAIELKHLQGWLAKGFDLQQDIRPAIDRTLAALPEGETIGSLSLIDRQLLGSRAKSRVAPKPVVSQPAAPLDFAKAGEGQDAAEFRMAAASTIGAAAYRAHLDAALLEPDADGGELRIIVHRPIDEMQLRENHLFRLEPLAARFLKCRLIKIVVRG